MIRVCFFDCFGVLYLNAGDAYFARFPEHYTALYDLNRQADHGYLSRDEYVAAVSGVTGVSIAETTRAFANEYIINQPLIDDIKRRLKPQYKIGMISNIGREWVQQFFDKHALHDLFDLVITSSEEGIAKPDPLIYERAAERIGTSPAECIMIDDRQENCDGALTAGMESLLFVSNKQ